jgi:hypothetical protein
VKSNNQKEPVPRQVHPGAPLNRPGIFPTPCGCAAGTGAQRPARSDTSRLLGGCASSGRVSKGGRETAAGRAFPEARLPDDVRCSPMRASPLFCARMVAPVAELVQPEKRGSRDKGVEASGRFWWARGPRGDGSWKRVAARAGRADRREASS